MEDFRQHIIELLSDLPKKESALLSEDWRFFLLLPRLHGLVQEKLFAVFTQETLQDVEKNRGLDYGYFMEEVMQNIKNQQLWLESLGTLGKSDYLVDRTQQQLKAAQTKVSDKAQELAIFNSEFENLKKKLHELERQKEELERLKANESGLRTRKKELEELKKWVKDKKIDHLEKEVKELEKEFKPLEIKRSDLESSKEKMTREKDKLSFEVERLLLIQRRLEGANRILEEWAPIIKSHNEQVLLELKEEKEILMIHYEANQEIATDLSASQSLRDQLAEIKERLQETDGGLAAQIEQNQQWLTER